MPHIQRLISVPHVCLLLFPHSLLTFPSFLARFLSFATKRTVILAKALTCLGFIVQSIKLNEMRFPACQCRRPKRRRFNPWVGKMPWRRAQQPSPVLLPGEPMDRGAWWAIVHRFAQSRTRLKRLSTHAFMIEISIMEMVKPLWKCIYSGTPTKHSGTGKSQCSPKPFWALAPGSSGCVVSLAVSSALLGWWMSWPLPPGETCPEGNNHCKHTALPAVCVTSTLTDPNLGGAGRKQSYSCSVTQLCLTLQPHGLQHTRLLCPSPSSRVCSDSCPLSWWCHLTISSSVNPFSSCP